MATRRIEIRDDLSLAFDHAAQYFTVSDPEFGKLVIQWINRGAVKEWKGSVGTLQAGGRFTELPYVPRYVGTHGMRALADHMVSQVGSTSKKVRFSCIRVHRKVRFSCYAG